jgi:hypothetical protein
MTTEALADVFDLAIPVHQMDGQRVALHHCAPRRLPPLSAPA